MQNTFDGDGSRLVRTAGGTTTTYYVGDFYEVNPTTGVATCSYPFNGQPVALKQGSTLFYLHRDQVGSVVSISDASAKEVASLRYAPFGNLRSLTFANGYSALPTDRLFTGQVRDLGDDRFYFFKARYYDATIGTFHTPDTVPPDPNFPLRLNHYAYADDNPLKYRDSSGHFSEIPDFLRSPSILINAPPSPLEQPTQPLINVAPPRLPSGPLIFTGQANVGTVNINVQVNLGLGAPLINVQTTQQPTVYKDDDGSQVYRGMKITPDGKPQIGNSARELGVRSEGPNADVEPDENGMIDPSKPMSRGPLPGMSVAPDPTDLPPFRRPPEFGGTGPDPVWSIDTDNLGPDLKYTQDSETHGLIQPSDTVSLDDYRDSLAQTQDDWTQVPPPDQPPDQPSGPS